jgi:hypothetical protein
MAWRALRAGRREEPSPEAITAFTLEFDISAVDIAGLLAM